MIIFEFTLLAKDLLIFVDTEIRGGCTADTLTHANAEYDALCGTGVFFCAKCSNR